MSRRNWKYAQPGSLRQALEWSLEYAKQRHNLSVERIADRMGIENHWVLYKWVTSGRIPAVLIPTFELVCGINLVSRWLAATSGKLLIDIPTGRPCGAGDTQALQGVLHTAVGALIAFHGGHTDAPTALAAIQTAMESLAWHRGNVQQHANPQFDLGEDSHE